MNWRSRYPLTSRLRLDGSLDRAGGAWSRMAVGERVLLPRGFCHFDVLPVPASLDRSLQAVRAAQLSAKTRSPFDNPDIRLVWGERYVTAWSWPVNQLPRELSAEARCLPESLCFAPADGLSLRSCDEGFEAQFWTDGELTASRWWRHRPGLVDIQTFARGAGAPLPDHEIQPVTAPSISPPRPPNQLLDLLSWVQPKDAAVAAILLIAAPFGFFGAQYASLSAREYSASAQLSELDALNAEAVEARAVFTRAAGKAVAYRDYVTGGEALEALAAFAEAASQFDGTLQRFAYREGALDILIDLPETITPIALVEALERDPLLSDVRFETTNRPGQSRVTAAVDRDRS